MQQSRLTSLSSLAALLFLFASCSGGGSEKTTATDTAMADTTANTPAVVNTIVTTPMNMVIVISKIGDYAKWKAAYDGHDTARVSHGLHNYVIGRGMKDSTMVLVALKADDTAKAMAFAKDPGLKAAMQKGGVMGKPNISFVTATWQDTATIDTRLRSMTTFAVKDWDAWVKSFEDGKQERKDNRITDRVIGHDLKNKNNVALVTAVSDTAKAFAYYGSDALKKRRAAGGVIGEPKRFLFRIVQRY